VREAIDRGVPLEEVRPGNNVSAVAQPAAAPSGTPASGSLSA
jgi:hypothetical protein